MQIYRGKSVLGGIAIGKIKIYKRSERIANKTEIADVELEIERFRQAKEQALKRLEEVGQRAVSELGKENGAIFEGHQMLLQDEHYKEVVETMIRVQRLNAEYAVQMAGKAFAQMFATMDDDYMKARAEDVQDISEQLLDELKGNAKETMQLTEPVILVAEDLAPSEIVQLDKDMILALVIKEGSVNSHTAILARSKGIPALIGTGVLLDAAVENNLGIVDGGKGLLYVEPDEETLQSMRKSRKEALEKKELLQSLKGKEDITLDGQLVRLYANIGSREDLDAVLENDAAGIGLFRSEFLYMERDSFPSEEEQFRIYKSIVETMEGKPVIIRTLDIGADKQCAYFGLEQEENPALGLRGIRVSFCQPEILKTQLRALLRASAYGRLAIMYPMIMSIEEVRRLHVIVEEVKAELEASGISYGNLPQGIMIETPAAVMISDELAKEVDFFSIGTNDLTQYTLAVDRQNPKLEAYYQPYHPAILRMIEMVVKNAHKAGITVGICGELAADRALTKKFLEIGVDELSVSPENILPMRKLIRETSIL